MDHSRRLDQLKDRFAAHKIDALLVTNQINVRYMSGFTGHDSMLLVTNNNNYLITDSRYLEQAEEEVRGFVIRCAKSSIFEEIEDLVKRDGFKKLGFESTDLSYEIAIRLKELLEEVALVPCRNIIESLRSIKEDGEILAIRRAVAVTKKVLDKIVQSAKPGISEISLYKNIEIEFIRLGAEAGFDSIVAAGKNASKPHAIPTDNHLTANSFVMFDIGCKLNGYNADITRMLMLGDADEEFKNIYSIVKEAQERAIEKIRPGARIADIDNAARAHIAEKGYGKNFGHAVGHSIGLEVHEKPSISPAEQEVLQKGMVFTVEPGIYIPGFGGARIEDMVLVTDGGCEILTR